jgi:glucose-1-phosphate thymidylyltransferase
MKVVILAAGLGKRLKPITEIVPKVMIPINSKPILEYVIKNFKEAGFKDLILVIGYKKEQILNYFGNGKKFGVNIEYVDQGKPLGTGHAVLITKDKISGNFVVCYGDSVLPTEHIKEVIKKFNESNLDSVLSVKKVSKEELKNLGNVIIKDDRVVDIIEKPSKEKSIGNVAFNGFAVFRNIIFKYLEDLPKRFAGEDGLPDAIVLMAKDGKAIEFVYAKERLHLTEKEDIEQISKEITSI